ncbi:unnamed protein product [Lupinus luteus]|uniref:UBX domain-containing protein n=1 Tax=Lupinus luteus TaxID=3873 RepID=A0AAV1WBS5_LUPLU
MSVTDDLIIFHQHKKHGSMHASRKNTLSPCTMTFSSNQNPQGLIPDPHDALVVTQEWVFLDKFEQQYGTNHPFFYACRFKEAMKLAEQDKKFMFMYLHSPNYPFANVLCKETLCSDLVTQFLDVNFVCWAALTDRSEGLQMVAMLRPASFPCCAVVAPAPSDSIAVLQQEKERLNNLPSKERVHGKQGNNSVNILIRFPNGERREHTLLCTDKIQSIFSYIDSLGLPGIGNYRLISNFPRKVYGVDQMRMTLKDAGFYPKATLFLEPL